MKRILGLDLGTASIGWAFITIDDKNNPINILGMGCRIVSMADTERTGFGKGNGETVCNERTAARSLRRRIDRFQQRCRLLGMLFSRYGLTFEKDLLKLDPIKLWSLRAEATQRQLTPAEIGRVIYHLNHRRGYRSAKSDYTDNTKSEYLTGISKLSAEAREKNMTPGQYFRNKLETSRIDNGTSSICTYRVKENIFPRCDYENELQQILDKQSEYYPEILTDKAKDELMRAVFHQRPLKSCKHLVSICDAETRHFVSRHSGKEVAVGPHVAPTSSPIAQVCRRWETVNNIVLKNPRNRRRNNQAKPDDRLLMAEYIPDRMERMKLFKYLNENETLTEKKLLELLGLTKDDGFSATIAGRRGIKGNSTRMSLKKALGSNPEYKRLLKFELNIVETDEADPETGELIRRVSPEYIKEPLYELWHTVYSISDREELANALLNKFGIADSETVDRLYSLDLRGAGYAQKSAKFMSKIIPYLIDGLHYSEACEMVGFNHSNSMTTEQNKARELKERIDLLEKGSLRQPVVEKILNQMIHLVNDIIEAYGRPDEVRIELARELKQSKDERAKTDKQITRQEKLNKNIAELIAEYGAKPTKNNIVRYRLWQEAKERCMYCGTKIGAAELLSGGGMEKEHVIPRSLFFDDSYSNKVCACRRCNAEKGQQTGYDYMASKGESMLNSYIDRVEEAYNEYKVSKGLNGISKTKHDRLLTKREDIPQDFLSRDLRLSQYIARKSMEILKEVCRNVYATSGAVTGFFRHAWGYDDVLHDINMAYYTDTDMTTEDASGHIRIKDWNKRKDHRHHAIDALVIASTRQGYIQRLNTLSAAPVDDTQATRSGNLDKWASGLPHFGYKDVKLKAEGTAVSMRSGKRVATRGKRYVYRNGGRKLAQEGIITPRGSMTYESVHGKIRVAERNLAAKELFGRVADICDTEVKLAVEKRLTEHEGNTKKAQESLKKKPLVKANGAKIDRADCWRETYVLKTPIEKVTLANSKNIVDQRVRHIVEEHLRNKGASKDSVITDPQSGTPIRSVRMVITQISDKNAVTVRRNSKGDPIGFSKNASNHHIALYRTPEGEIEEYVVTMQDVVERKLAGLPMIVKDPRKAWKQVDNDNKPCSEAVLAKLPMADRRFLMSLDVHGMYVIGMDTTDIMTAIDEQRYDEIVPNLYQAQNFAQVDYHFYRSTVTEITKDKRDIETGNYIRVRSISKLIDCNIVKVRVDRLGRITLADEAINK